MVDKKYKQEFFECRAGCAACCVAISISSKIPGMPNGKPAGTPCIHLSTEGLCALFNKPERPKVCSDFKAEKAICGSNQSEALKIISELEGIDIPIWNK